MFGEGEEVVVYRIIQEACQNVVKHAEAKNLHIQMTAHDKVVSLVIEDDGKGFNKSDISTGGGMGLKNIESRVRYLSGQLTIDSRPGTGTVINVEITLRG